MLQSSISPVVDGIEVKFDESIVSHSVPNPNKVPYLLKNDPMTLFFFLNKNINEDFKTEVKLKFMDPILEKLIEFSVIIDA